jgi:hypothetical protein
LAFISRTLHVLGVHHAHHQKGELFGQDFKTFLENGGEQEIYDYISIELKYCNNYKNYNFTL